MARHYVVIDVEDPTVCVVCMYPADACICEDPPRLRTEEMQRVRHRQEWTTAILDGARRIWARVRFKNGRSH